jgi:hypothetical protein
MMIRQASWIGPMTAFRLIRRLLLCSIVGVTVFGVTGWLLRPQPSWEIDCSQWNGRIALLSPNRDASTHEPIWVEAAEPDTGQYKTVIAVDPQRGLVAHRWDLTHAETRHPLFVADDGSLIATCSGRFQSTSFRLFDGRSGGEPIHRDLPRYWQPTGNSVWLVEAPRGVLFVLKIADLRSGAIKSFEMTAPGEHWSRRPGASDLSPDGKRIVVQEPPTDKEGESEAFQIWDVESKTRLQRLTLPLPKNAERGRLDHLRWIDGGRRIAVTATMWFKNDPAAQPFAVVFDLAARKFTDLQWSPIRVSPTESKESVGERHDDGDVVVWTDRADESSPRWFMVTQNRRTLAPWRRYPFTALSVNGIDIGLAPFPSYAVPGSNEIIFWSDEPTLWSLLPSGFRIANSSGLGGRGVEERLRWHNWETNEWRDVGCCGDVEDIQIRPNALIAVVKEDNGARTLLQSWPLPPRDPKWPAAGMAALSFAGAWGLCARRAKKKMLAV